MEEGLKKKKSLCFSLSKTPIFLDKYSAGRCCASFHAQLWGSSSDLSCD